MAAARAGAPKVPVRATIKRKTLEETLDVSTGNIEHCAQLAYRMARVLPHVGKCDTGPLHLMSRLLDVVAKGDPLNLVDIGVPTGRARVEWSAKRVTGVAIRTRQRSVQHHLAASHACAQIVARSLNEEWPEPFALVVAAAIMMPARPFLGACDEIGLLAAAADFCVDDEVAVHRLRLLRGERGLP